MDTCATPFTVLLLNGSPLYAVNLPVLLTQVWPGAEIEIASIIEAALTAAGSRRFEAAIFETSHFGPRGLTQLVTGMSGQWPCCSMLIVGRRDAWLVGAIRGLRAVSIFDCSTEGANRLAIALRTMAGGSRYVSVSVARVWEKRTRAGFETRLSVHQQRVLSEIGDGSSNAEAGERLGMSESAVAGCRRSIMNTLGLHGCPEMMRFALQHGFVVQASDGALMPGLVGARDARSALRLMSNLQKYKNS
ncbi:MAG: hypothetical protein ACREIA_27040 [Opitutaceae bacterium]